MNLGLFLHAKCRLRLFIFVSINLSFCAGSYAQSSADSAVYSQSVVGVVNRFNNKVGEGLFLFNGYVYKGYASYIKGSPNLHEASNWNFGNVDYDGTTYNHIPMLYDLNADALVVFLSNRTMGYRLISDKVKSFELLNSVFKRIPDNTPGLKSGYYELLYGGRSEVLNKLSKTLKTIHNPNTAEPLETYFVPVKNLQDYYIRKGGTYYSVGSLGSVLDLFADKKKEIKKFIKDNNVQYDAMQESSLAKIARFYDLITE